MIILIADYVKGIPDYIWLCKEQAEKCDKDVRVISTFEGCNNKLLDEFNELDFGNLCKFRDGFWIKTIRRFFLLYGYMLNNKIDSCFHLENDVLIYTTTEWIKKEFIIGDGIYAVLDNIDRAIASIFYVSKLKCLEEFLIYVLERIKKKGFMNDMQLLGNYPKLRSFPVLPTSSGLFDACALGQVIGGIDPRNQGGKYNYNFINETSVFKPDIKKIRRNNEMYYYNGVPIHNLHIHSKMLNLFMT